MVRVMLRGATLFNNNAWLPSKNQTPQPPLGSFLLDQLQGARASKKDCGHLLRAGSVLQAAENLEPTRTSNLGPRLEPPTTTFAVRNVIHLFWFLL